MTPNHGDGAAQHLMAGNCGGDDQADLGDDQADLDDDAFAALQQLRERWRSRRHGVAWSEDRLPDVDLGDVDWPRYDPPAALRKAPGITSQMLLDIVASSIDKVRARADEQRRQRIDEDQRRAAEEEAARQARKGKAPEPYLPIIMGPREPPDAAGAPADGAASRAPESTSAAAVPASAASAAAASASCKAEKRRRFALRRLFHRGADRGGESSSAGGAREALRQRLEATLGGADLSSTDLDMQKTTLELRKSGFFQTPTLKDAVECVSCLDDFPRKSCVKVPCHSYCGECFVRLVTAAVEHEQQWPPKCCLNEIPFRTVLEHIPDDLKGKFQERAAEWEMAVSERLYCCQAECAVWIQPRHISLSKRQGRCRRGHLTCTICRGPHHGKKDCPQDRDMDLTMELAEEEGWKRCFRCHALVEHTEACQHMRCRCGTEFCYVCGRVWRSCSCTMQQLQALKDAARERRERRLLREAAEAEELRLVLAQIEEFEREEARRAELERLEQARLEEERWQRQLRERVRQETVRRKEVELKYEELRARLDGLHELQQVLMETQQEDDAAELAKESKAMRDQLAEEQEAERARIDGLVRSRMAAKEHDFAGEHAVRAAQERKLAAAYQQQLRAFWSGKAGAAEEVEAAMLALRKRMDQGHGAWQRWKDEQLAAYRTRLDGERTVREELRYSAAQRLASRCEARQTALARRAAAERKWAREVMLERERLLGGLERDETEGDADSLGQGGEEEEEEEEEEVSSYGVPSTK